MNFGGLLAGALGQTFSNVGQMHMENAEKERLLERDAAQKRGLLMAEAQFKEQSKLREEERVRVLKMNEQRELAQAMASVPEEVRTNPTALINHFVDQGKPELAQNMLDLLEGRAEIASKEALTDDRRASAELDRARTRDVGRDRMQPTATQREFEQWSQMTPEQQAQYREFKDVGRSSADWASGTARVVNEYDSAPPEMQARLWDIEYQEQLAKNLRALDAYALPAARAQAEADARRSVEALFRARPGAAPAPAAASSAQGDLPRPSTMAEVNALPSGTRFVAPDGSVRVKP